MIRTRHSVRATMIAASMIALAAPAAIAPASARDRASVGGSEYDALVAKHAAANGVPESLVRRIIMRESRYNPRAVSRGNYGMMQIKPATARSMGYSGSAAGLLDADTNMTYAVKYLAGAYRVAGGNADRAVSYYARGYYGAAKQRGETIGSTTASVGADGTFALASATRADVAQARNLSRSGGQGGFAVTPKGPSQAASAAAASEAVPPSQRNSADSVW